MPLQLTPEDGTGLANANTYATLQQVRDYAAQRGATLPDADDDVIELMTEALDYLESYETRWQGERGYPATQALSWPRVNVMFYGVTFTAPTMSNILVKAQCYLTTLAVTIDLNPAQDTRAITKEVIGPIETDYSPTAGASVRPVLPMLDSMVAQLMASGAGMLTSVRM